MIVRLSPVLAGLGTYPFVRLEAGPRAAARRRRRDHRLRHGRAARGDAAVHPRGAGGRDHAARALPERRRAARAARGDRGWAGRRFGAALDPDTEVIPTLGSKEAVFGARARLRRRPGRGIPHARVPGLRPRRALRGQGVRRAAAARGGRLAAGPRRASTGSRVVDPVAQLPEQPDRRDRPARVLRAGRGAGARARVRARLRRGLLGALLRRRARPQSALQVAICAQRRGVQHAVQALVDARLPRPVSSPATRRSSPR